MNLSYIKYYIVYNISFRRLINFYYFIDQFVLLKVRLAQYMLSLSNGDLSALIFTHFLLFTQTI